MVRADSCRLSIRPSTTAEPYHRDYLLLLLFTGLRRREAAAMQWSEVDFASA